MGRWPASTRWVPAALAVGVLGVSSASLLVRLSEAPAAVLAFWRLALSALVLMPLAVRAARARPVPAGDLLRSALSGAALALHLVSWIASLRYTAVATSVLLVTLHPAFVLAAERWLLREPVPRDRLWGAALALVGAAVVAGGGVRPGSALGNALALAGALCVAAYLLLGRQVRQRVPASCYAAVAYGSAALLILGGLLLTGTPVTAYPAREFALFAGLALGPTLLGHTLFNWALGHLPAGAVAVAVLGEPVGATLLAWAFLGEPPGGRELVGGALVLAGLVRAVAASPGPGAAAGQADPTGA